MEIRTAVLADATALGPLFAQWGHPLGPEDRVRQLRRWSETPLAELSVALVRGEVAGMAAVVAVPHLARVGHAARLAGLVVGEHHRRHGVGRALLAHVTDLALTWGCDRIELTSSRARDAAHAFYLAAGYRETSGEQARYVLDLPL